MNWSDINLLGQMEFAKNELAKLDIKINLLLNSIDSVKKEIHRLAFYYKRSFHKSFYMNFSSISLLCDYRIDLSKQHFEMNETLNNYYKELKICNRMYVSLTNSYVMYSILLNK